MSNVADICKATRRHGNALVLLLLVKTWEGDEPPTRDELAELAHLSTRQAERDLLKLVEDGEIEKVGRRGQVTRFQMKGLTDVSDETDNQRTDTSDAQPTEVSDLASHLPDVSVESAISDIPLSVSSDTSVRPLNGTPIAPYSAIRTSTDIPPPSEEGANGKKRRSTPHPPDDEFLDSLQAKPAYTALDVRHVYAKMVVWCETKRKQPTRMRLINWLNREDVPMNGGSNGHQTRQQKPTRADTYHGYDYSDFDGAEGEGAGRPDSEIPPDEWVEPPSPSRSDGDDRRLARSSRH